MQRHGQGRRRLWNAWFKRHARAACIVMRRPCLEQPFAEGVRLQTLGWCFQDLELQVEYAVIELRRKDAIAIMNEEAIGVVREDRVP